MKVAAVVVSHGNAAELERTLPALAPQVDELLLIANPIADSIPADLHGARPRLRVCEDARQRLGELLRLGVGDGVAADLAHRGVRSRGSLLSRH